jgi:hypothetical protein
VTHINLWNVNNRPIAAHAAVGPTKTTPKTVIMISGSLASSPAISALRICFGVSKVRRHQSPCDWPGLSSSSKRALHHNAFNFSSLPLAP